MFHPESISIKKYKSEITDHTEFFLPRAFDTTSFIRKELKRQAITKTEILKFISEIMDSRPNILLFLRNLRCIEVRTKGIANTEYTRDDNNLRYPLFSTGKEAWRIKDIHKDNILLPIKRGRAIMEFEQDIFPG